MKSNFLDRKKRGFTLVELIIAVAIMAIILALAGNMLKDPGATQGIEMAMQSVKDKLAEAKLEAQSKSTWTRFVVVSDPDNTSAHSRNLRFIAVMVMEPERVSSASREIVAHKPSGVWKMSSRGIFLPPGFFISPRHSTLLETSDASVGSSNSFAELKEHARLSAKGNSDVFFIEFDPQGRMTEPSKPTRLVVIKGRYDAQGGEDGDGIVPAGKESDGLPRDMAGVVIWPKGNISDIKSREQFGQ